MFPVIVASCRKPGYASDDRLGPGGLPHANNGGAKSFSSTTVSLWP